MNELRDRVARAIADSVSSDQESPGVRLWDLLDFSGENKAHMVCRAASDAAIATVQGAGWQDIATAPRDVQILLAWPKGGRATIGRFDTDQYAKNPRPFFTGHWRGKLWERENQPTHWMPLPTPPFEGTKT